MNLRRQKVRLVNRVDKRIERMCSLDFTSCSVSFCSINKKCCKGKVLKKAMPIDEIKAIYDANSIDWNKYLNSVKPAIDESVLERANYILGLSIFEHELIKGKQKYIDRIKRCSTLKEIIVIMNQSHFEEYGYRLKFKR